MGRLDPGVTELARPWASGGRRAFYEEEAEVAAIGIPIRMLVLLFAVLLLAGGGAGVMGVAQAHDGVDLHLDTPKGKACVLPEEQMRRTHMDFLKHRRDETVRRGVRLHEESLLNCQTCHTSRQQFCDKCHDYVGVKPDCFQCHIYK